MSTKTVVTKQTSSKGTGETVLAKEANAAYLAVEGLVTDLAIVCEALSVDDPDDDIIHDFVLRLRGRAEAAAAKVGRVRAIASESRFEGPLASEASS
jgi:hypothetical protein